jgi:hypothetical protein
MTEATKVITYRGGIVTFKLPANWTEEYEPGGGGTFYEDRPNSGTFRLSVLSFSSNGSKAAEEMARTAHKSDAEFLRGGLWLRTKVTSVVENGETLNVHHWDVAVPVPPDNLRIAMFSYTILAGQESDPVIARELGYLAESIRSADFSRERGVSV